MSNTLLNINNLSVSFKSEKGLVEVISCLSLNIKKGEVFGLVGESGSGKSLASLSVLKLLPQNAIASGEISFNGKNLLSLNEDAIRQIRGKEISMIFQEPMTSLNPVLTAGYQIAEALTAHFDMPKTEAMDRAIQLMRSVKIPSPEMRAKDYPHQMSGGMRQRIMIAMAIACNPSLIIADEPTTALDVTIQAQILNLIQGFREERKMSVLLITHDLAIISEQADRAAVMYAGRIMETADVDELFSNPLHPYTKGLMESLPAAKDTALKPIPGFVPQPENFPAGCKFSGRCAKASEECGWTEPELKKITEGHFVRCIY
jgi:oligopeptide/dipeptide ABC transporter ATP-binding protein